MKLSGTYFRGWHLAWDSEVVSYHGKLFFDHQIKEEHIFYDGLPTLYHPSTFYLLHSPFMQSPTTPIVSC